MPRSISEKILNLLKPHNRARLPLRAIALTRLDHDKLTPFYEFLIRVKTESKRIGSSEPISRPKCPVKNERFASVARRPYKVGMAEYIAQRGYRFETPCSITPSLFEATANYLERK